jgi:predicted Rdx family selenoprotein
VVNGSNIWDRFADGSYGSDFYVDTPVFNGYSPGIPQCSTTGPPPGAVYHVSGTGGIGLRTRSGPGTGYGTVGLLAEGTAVTINCQTTGTVVNGSNIWDRFADGSYGSDFYVDTPVFNGYSPGIPQCSSAPPPQTFTLTPRAGEPAYGLIQYVKVVSGGMEIKLTYKGLLRGFGISTSGAQQLAQMSIYYYGQAPLALRAPWEDIGWTVPFLTREIACHCRAYFLLPITWIRNHANPVNVQFRSYLDGSEFCQPFGGG